MAAYHKTYTPLTVETLRFTPSLQALDLSKSSLMEHPRDSLPFLEGPIGHYAPMFMETQSTPVLFCTLHTTYILLCSRPDYCTEFSLAKKRKESISLSCIHDQLCNYFANIGVRQNPHPSSTVQFVALLRAGAENPRNRRPRTDVRQVRLAFPARPDC